MFRKIAAIRHACFLLVFTLCTSIAYGATRTWTGNGGDASWNNSANWDTGVPEADDDVVIAHANSGLYPKITDSDSVASLNKLTVRQQATITISSSAHVSVNAALENAGTIIYTSTGRVAAGGVVPLGDDAHDGTVVFSGNIIVESVLYYNLHIDGTCTFGNSISIKHHLQIGLGKVLSGTGVVTVGDSIDVAGTLSCTGLTFSNAATVSNTGTITVAGNLTAPAGVSVTETTINIAAASTITGNNTFAALVIDVSASSVRFLGNNTFSTLRCMNNNGELRFAGGTTQSITSSLKLSGTAPSSGSYLTLKIDDTGRWKVNFTNPTPSSSNLQLQNLSVANSNNISSFSFKTYLSDCENTGNNISWFSDICEWTGITSSEWNTASNWNNTVPTSSDKVIIPSGTPHHPRISSASTVGNLEIKASAQITLENGNLTTDTLVNAGTINYTGSGRITDGSNFLNDVANNGTVSYGNSSGSIESGTNGKYANLTVLSGTWTASNDIVVNNTLRIEGDGYFNGTTTADEVIVDSSGKATFTTTATFKNVKATSSAEMLALNMGTSPTTTTIHENVDFKGGTIQFGSNDDDAVTINGKLGISSTLQSSLAGTITANEMQLNCPIALTKKTTLIAVGTTRTVTMHGTVTGNNMQLQFGNNIHQTSVNFDKAVSDIASLVVYGSVQTNAAAAITAHNITIKNSLQSNGTLTCGSTLTFTGNVSEVTGSGSISAQYIAFSPTSASGELSVSAAEITVSGNITVSTGKIRATSGTIKLTGNAATVSGNNTFATVTCTGANAMFNGSNTFTVLEATGTNITFNGNNTFGTFTCTGANATFNGSNTFETLTCIDAGAKTLTFAASTTQTVTAKLALTGTNILSLLILKSNTPGSRWNILFTGIPQASNLGLRYLDVTDSENISPDVFKAAYSKTTDTSRNNVRWTDPPSPEFILTVAPLGEKQLLIVFSTELEIDMIKGAYALERIKDNLMIESIDAPGIRTHTFIGNARTAFRNYDATGLIFTLNKTITLNDLKKTCIRVLDDVGAEQDILPGKWIPYIQSTDGGYIRGGSAHTLSDFAVNAVQPLYAYDSGSLTIGTTFDASKSFTIRNWDKEQLANGSLLVDKDVYIQTQLFDGTNGVTQTFDANIYLDCPTYMGNTGSSEINNKTGFDWRVWLPTAFNNLSSNYNTSFISVAGNVPNGLQKLFHLPVTTDLQYNVWQRDDQISFMFDIRDIGGIPVEIIHGHDPTYSGSSYSGSPAPLYALRLKNSNDLTSLDLWSFRLKEQTTQRGGVSIFNNVINANSGENVLIKVNVPKAGRLSVIVMTLDGSVVQQLERSTVQQGERVYSWNGTTASGKKVARGMYFVRVVGVGIDETRKVMVVKE